MKGNNRNLLIVSLVAVVNMLGYGIIIPILYAYSKRFGLTDFQNGLLFASYSLCQFISTPIIGRLSDKYGRRPMLLVSIAGTTASFFLMAFAPSAAFLFIARMLDGITAGNVPVVFAVISDSTDLETRPKAYGRVGAAFSFGFIFGPAISALTVGYFESLPLIIAGSVTFVALLLTYFFLPETNKHMGEITTEKLFDFKKMWKTLFDQNVGMTFIISLVYILAFSAAIIYGFQPFTMNVLHVTQSQNATLFTIFGVIGFITQWFIVGFITDKFGKKKAFRSSMLLTSVAFLIMFFSSTLPVFIVAMILLGMVNSIVQTLISAILSSEADEKSQGTILGLNASYQSIGMIVGPIVGGLVASVSAHLPFVLGCVLVLLCFFLSAQILKPGIKRESAF